MQNDIDNYLRDLARSCAKEAFEKAREKASRSDFMGINSGKVAKIVVNNRKGADDMLLSLAAKSGKRYQFAGTNSDTQGGI